MIPVLDVIGAEMVAMALPIRIEGHTDETSLRSTRYRDNWDLSSSRAYRCLRTRRSAMCGLSRRLSVLGRVSYTIRGVQVNRSLRKDLARATIQPA